MWPEGIAVAYLNQGIERIQFYWFIYVLPNWLM
jgi:hypothetical protein